MYTMAIESQRKITLNNPISDLVFQLPNFSGARSNMYEEHYTSYIYSASSANNNTDK